MKIPISSILMAHAWEIRAKGEIRGFQHGVTHATNMYMETLALFHEISIALFRNLLPLQI